MIQKRLLRVFGVFALCFFAAVSIASAAPLRKVTSFNAQSVTEDSENFLRIEIGFNGPIKDYTVKGDRILSPELLTVDIENGERGDVRKEIKLNPEYGNKLVFQEVGKRLRIAVYMNQPAEEQNFQVYVLEKERRGGKPHRLVIELYGEGGRRGKTPGLKGRTIVVDPGHGGTDSGATGVGGIKEKDITLKVAKKVRDLLVASGAKVVMTREDDRDVYGPTATDYQELQARVDYGFSTPDTDVFLSIHCNAYTSSSANGTETYYYPKTSLDSLLARKLQEGMISRGERRDRGISEARFYVCRHSSVPAALVELAFVTNYVEGHLLADEDFQNEMAQGIVEGLSSYFREATMKSRRDNAKEFFGRARKSA